MKISLAASLMHGTVKARYLDGLLDLQGCKRRTGMSDHTHIGKGIWLLAILSDRSESVHHGGYS